jgi:hypothetical protein
MDMGTGRTDCLISQRAGVGRAGMCCRNQRAQNIASDECRSCPRVPSDSPRVRTRHASAFAALVIFIVVGCCSCRAQPRGMPVRNSGSHGRGARAGGGEDLESEADSGLIIEGSDEDDQADWRSDADAITCTDLEFPEQMIDSALALAQQGRGEEGLECLRAGAQQDPPPDFADFFDALAQLEEKHGARESERAALLRALEIDPDYAVALLRLGNW